MHKSAMSIAIAVAVGLGVSVAVSADGPDEWFKSTRTSVTISTPGSKDFSRVVMSATASQDVRIESSGLTDGKNYAGVLMVVAGTRMLSKGVAIEPGTEIDALDVPVLQVRLVCELLSRAFPKGPGSLAAAQSIQLLDRNDPIKVNTPSAGGEYPVPWTLRGTAKPDGAGKAFDLAFSCTGMAQPLRVVGTWTAAGPPIELPDSMSVAGWRVFSLGPYTKQDGGGTMFDYGAQEVRKPFTSLGDVRRDAARLTK